MRTTFFSLLCGISVATTAQSLPLTPLTEATPLADYYAINFSADQTYTNTGRHLNGIVLNSPSEGVQSADISASSKVYNVVSTQQFLAAPGETVTPSFQFSGNWMNGYVYLDRDNDGAFDALIEDNGCIAEGSDIMAFSYFTCANGNACNSEGEITSNGNVLNPPAFTIPADLPHGLYRMRYKVDWNNLNPAGRPEDGNGILKNGGAICDILLNLHGETCALQVNASNGQVTDAEGNALGDVVPFGKPLTLNVTPNEGYVCDGLRVRHGYNLSATSDLYGLMQWEEEVIPAYLFKGNTVTLPARCMNGEVSISAIFIEQPQQGEVQGDYPLNFDASLALPNTDNKFNSATFSSAGAKVGTISPSRSSTAVYYDLTDNEVHVIPGNTLTATLSAKGTLPHYYLYIDFNQDGQFAATLNADGTSTLSGELVSYTYLNGKNSLGEAVAIDAKATALPEVVIPATLPIGVYRARLKVDYDNTDPAGSERINEVGGCVVDFLLNVHNAKHSLEVLTENGSIHGNSNTGLPLTFAPYTTLPIVPTPIASGYKASEIVIRHGHNLNGPEFIHGNRQWEEYTVEAKNQTLPAKTMNGDVIISASFQPTESAEYELVFSDEFNQPDGSRFDESKWISCQRQGATWNRWLADRPEVHFINDGKLVCRAVPNPYQDEDPVPMITGGVKSQGKFAFTYGKVECRALSNPWIGNFPAIWMMPADNSKGWPNAGEIDIWEVIDTDERSYHTIHSNWSYNLGNTGNPKSSFNTPVKLDRYHTYGLEWDAKSLNWYVDGRLVGTYEKSTDSSVLNQGQWPFDKHFYLILNQSVGNGAWAANADVNHVYETTFDWIRVYQKKGQQNTDGTVDIEEVGAPSAPAINVVEGGILVNSITPQTISVYDLCGRLIDNRSVVGTARFCLPQGIYLVNGTKVVVK